MRLYKLLVRNGLRKRRFYPWFEAPAAGAPQRYNGWTWNPAIKEWVRDVVEAIDVEVMVPTFPRPPEAPRPAQQINVPGWYWNGRAKTWEEIPLSIIEMSEGFERGPMPGNPPGPAGPTEVKGWGWSEENNEWVATIVIAQRITIDPPVSFPPDVDFAAVIGVYPMVEQYKQFNQTLIGMGLDQFEAKKIADMMVDGFWNMSRSALTKHRAELYAESFTQPAVALSDKLEAVGVYGAMVLLAAVVGLVIGNIMQRLILPEQELYFLREEKGTYLVGPEDWKYSKFIGLSPDKRLYFSECQGIGTSFTRHKRGWGAGAVDTIDFPGGFIESGYQFPYWIKYTWQTWSIEYVGMLESVGQNLYRLKVGRGFTGRIEGRGRVLPSAKWCSGFDYYL